jgi:hypothetical protein
MPGRLAGIFGRVGRMGVVVWRLMLCRRSDRLRITHLSSSLGSEAGLFCR